MKQATSLKNVQVDLLLPSMVVNTLPTDYRVNKQLQMMRFKGERREGFSPIITDGYNGWDDLTRGGGGRRTARRLPVGTFATCRPYRAMAAFRSNPEEFFSVWTQLRHCTAEQLSAVRLLPVGLCSALYRDHNGPL
jgi:hypothetical protein